MLEILQEIYTQTPLVFRFGVIFAIWAIICLWKIFVKAWRKWWEALIPIWHIYVLFKISKRVNPWFWILLPLPIIIYFLSGLVMLSLFTLNIDIYNRMLLIYYCFWFIAFAIYIIMIYWLTLVFWKSRWFFIWLFFFWPIFFWILAFDKSKYLWNK